MNMDQEIISNISDIENQETTFQEKVYVLSDEVVKIIKELHQEQEKLVNSRRIAKKMFTKESIKKILNNCSLERD